MSNKRFLSTIRSAGVGAILAAAAVVAQAGAPFVVKPAHFGSGKVNFTSDKLLGGGNTGATFTPGTQGSTTLGSTVTGLGYTAFSNFYLGGLKLTAAKTGLDSDYQMWGEFNFTLALTGGGLANANSTYKITSLTFMLYGEILDGLDDAVFNPGSLTTNPGVTHSGDTEWLGMGTLVSGSAAINADGGSSINPLLGFGLTPLGADLFVQPNPFYELAFASFTNTSLNIKVDNTTGRMYLTTEGGADFLGRVPEPASLALVGLALVGLGVTRRRATA